MLAERLSQIQPFLELTPGTTTPHFSLLLFQLFPGYFYLQSDWATGIYTYTIQDIMRYNIY